MAQGFTTLSVANTQQIATQQLIAQNRFGLGLRFNDAKNLRDPQAAILAQIENRNAALLRDQALLTSFELLKIARDVDEARHFAREPANPPPFAAANIAANNAMRADNSVPATKNFSDGRSEFTPYRDELAARFNLWATTPNGFVERLVQFWSNHFAISTAKSGQLRVIAGAYEREAIRPFVLGRFADMLLAVEKHPAMLMYLDNNQSIGPHSLAAGNNNNPNANQRGLNENLGREILELHTLGVDGGYTQGDVTMLARIITGWTVSDVNIDAYYGGRFTFAPARHEPGDAILLGHSYPNTGEDEGEAALRELARHPSTSQHIALKFAKAFIADDPPPTLVAKLKQSFLDSDGDLQKLAQTLVTAPESWQAPLTKLRTPQEFLCASLRATNCKPDPGPILSALNALGQPLWQPIGPDGFSNAVPAWLSPEGISVRLDVATALAHKTPGDTPKPLDLADLLFGPALSPETRQTISQAESREQGFALLLMSPEFQRR